MRLRLEKAAPVTGKVSKMTGAICVGIAVVFFRSTKVSLVDVLHKESIAFVKLISCSVDTGSRAEHPVNVPVENPGLSSTVLVALTALEEAAATAALASAPSAHVVDTSGV